jgi:hypothetical protein
LSAPPEVDKPIVVFISSAQEEFEKFRLQLKETLNSEPWSNQNVIRAVLIESQRRTVIPNEIRDALDQSSIYVGIFGRQLRDWPVAEFKYARSCILPQLIYKYERPSRRGRPSRHRRAGRRTEVERFLEREAYGPGIRVFGPYHNLDELQEEIIPGDIAITVAQMVGENADIRRRLYQSIPQSTITASRR